MLRKVLRRILEPRHFWREVGFSELNELYASNLLRRLSISVLMIFVPFYLYKNGYSVTVVLCMYGVFFVARIICDFIAGFVVARYGPKHTMILAAVLQVISSALFMTVPAYHWSFVLMGAVWGASASFYFIAFHVEFSKIKHLKHSGSEIGYMNVVERFGAALGPAIGGVLAVLFGPTSIFIAATLMAFASLWPLFRTREPVKVHQKLHFKTFPLARAKRDIMSYMAHGVENTLCVNLWPFYISLFVLTGSVYVQLGVMSSVTVLASVYTAHTVGKMLDKHSGVKLLRLSVLANTGFHLMRPFVHTVVPAYGLSIANEVVTNGYRIPFVKGFYAAADEYPGFRIVYVVIMEVMGNIAKATALFFLALCSLLYDARSALVISFMVAAVASLFIMTERFRALRGRGVL